jgi:hypothetical protein
VHGYCGRSDGSHLVGFRSSQIFNTSKSVFGSLTPDPCSCIIEEALKRATYPVRATMEIK